MNTTENHEIAGAIAGATKPKRRSRGKTLDLTSELMAFENGTLSGTRIVTLFSRLITTGLAWKLQGFYGRRAKWLIDSGYIAPNGVVLKYPAEE